VLELQLIATSAHTSKMTDNTKTFFIFFLPFKSIRFSWAHITSAYEYIIHEQAKF
jgi:hypothetical protein